MLTPSLDGLVIQSSLGQRFISNQGGLSHQLPSRWEVVLSARGSCPYTQQDLPLAQILARGKSRGTQLAEEQYKLSEVWWQQVSQALSWEVTGGRMTCNSRISEFRGRLPLPQKHLFPKYGSQMKPKIQNHTCPRPISSPVQGSCALGSCLCALL